MMRITHAFAPRDHHAIPRREPSLPVPPFPLEVDPHRRDTAPRAAITRLPQRKPRVEAIEPGIMDMGGLE